MMRRCYQQGKLPFMGATPTAIANMQAVTDRYLPSPKAFLIVADGLGFNIKKVNANRYYPIVTIFIKLPFM